MNFKWWHPLAILLQCTWGLPQTLLGLILFLINIKSPHDFYNGSIRTRWRAYGGVSLGLFFFSHDGSACPETVGDSMSVHEHGHTFQSLILGPLYLIVIGIPSTVWAGHPYYRRLRLQNGIPYSAAFCEKWADALGEKATGHTALREWSDVAK